MKEDTFVVTLREYIDFVNQQVGMYTDACSGFAGNKTIVERQVMRISRAVGSKIDNNGNRIVMRASLEDPSQPDVIHQRIIRAVDYIAENSKGGLHEQQHARSIIVFLYAYWEEEIRPRLAKAKGVKTDQIISDIMGDLRILRHAILHTKATLGVKECGKLKKLSNSFSADVPVLVSHDKMHKIFILIKQEAGRFMLEHVGQENGPIQPKDIRDIAIQGDFR
jgi:hypothetical protein